MPWPLKFSKTITCHICWNFELPSSSESQDGDDVLQFASARELAAREVLQIISRSRDDPETVFDAILENTARLCNAPMASLNLVEETGTRLVLRAHWGKPFGHFEPGVTEFLLNGSSVPAQAVLEKRVVHVEDMSKTDAYRNRHPQRVKAVEEEGIRTFLAVPLMRGDEAVGCIALIRREVKPFDDRYVDLVETFADQAVIAIDNARLIEELRTQQRDLTDSLEHQTATSEILQLISSSQTEIKPLLETVAETTCRICEAYDAVITLRDGDWLRLAAHFGPIPFDVEGIPVDGDHSTSRTVREGRPVHIEDILAVADKYPDAARLAERTGWRSVLTVPLMKDGQAIGAIGVRRVEPRAFTQRQIHFAQTFANQAVIAIENARLFQDLQKRTEELTELNGDLENRVQTQVDQLERLGRLRRFLSPQVADAVLSTGEDTLLGSHRALIAVLFCDIRGFTAFCETAEPEETIDILQTYHQEMGMLIDDHGAGVDHRSGDGIMVIFNDPLPCDDPAGTALRMAVAMRERMSSLCDRWRRLGHKLGFGVGIALGYATVGVVGSEGRYDYTASGTTVNLAARLCDEAEDGEILLSPRARAAVDGEFETEPMGERILKGIHAPVEVFRVTSANSEAGPPNQSVS